MKNNILFLILGGVVVFILMRSCKEEKITIPESVSKFETKTEIQQTPINASKTVEVPKWYKDTKKEKELKQELNAYVERVKLYEEEINQAIDYFTFQDSLSKIEIYKKSQQLNEFTQIWEDDLSELTVTGVVQGHIKEITPYLRIKEREISKPKEKNFSLSGGLGTDFNAQSPVLKVGAGYKNYKFDYLKINNQNFGVISYEIRF